MLNNWLKQTVMEDLIAQKVTEELFQNDLVIPAITDTVMYSQ